MIEARALTKQFRGVEVLKGVDLRVDRGEVVALIGPSGSGKSTFLRCLNLLETPDSGQLRFLDEELPYREWSNRDKARHRSRLGMVFQHFDLFAHLSVLANLTEGPTQVLKLPAAEAEQRALELLQRVGLAHKAQAWPAQLSGGQKQRVAIARALAMRPEALLLDEVTSALDVEMVADINDLLLSLAGEMTMVVVTHDLAFAGQVANRVCMFDAGQVVESGPAEQVLTRPQSERTQRFLKACRFTPAAPIGHSG